jgi:PhnB protein
MASDGRCGGQTSFQGFALSLTVPNEVEADRLFSALANGGQMRCRWPRPSFRLASGWSLTALACRG